MYASENEEIVDNKEVHVDNSNYSTTPLSNNIDKSTTLGHAPHKKRAKKKPKRRLFKDKKDSFQNTLHECEKLLPDVILKLRQQGTLCQSFLHFLTLIANDSLPLDNISLLLFFDVIEFYTLKSQTRHRFTILRL